MYLLGIRMSCGKEFERDARNFEVFLSDRDRPSARYRQNILNKKALPYRQLISDAQ